MATWRPDCARAIISSTSPTGFSRSTGRPPMRRRSGPVGPANISFLPNQTIERSDAHAIAIVSGKSRFDVCGAATITHTGSGGGSPTRV